MKASAFTALIPSDAGHGFSLQHKGSLIKCYLCHQVEFSKVVTKKKDHRATLLEWVEDTINSTMAGVEVPYIPNKTRLDCLDQLEIWNSVASNFKNRAVVEAADELERVFGVVNIP